MLNSNSGPLPIALGPSLPKIRYVDLARAARSVREGKAVAARVAAEEARIEKDSAQILVLTRIAEDKLTQEPDPEERSYQQSVSRAAMEERWVAVGKAKRDLVATEKRELAGVTQKVSETASVLGTRGGYLMLAGDQVAWARPGLDLTDQVIELLDAR